MHVRAFVRERFGSAGLERLSQLLSQQDFELLNQAVAIGWYELDAYARLLRAFDTCFGNSDLMLCRSMGRYQAERDSTTLHRLFFRLANPGYLIEKTGEYWRRFQDTGSWSVERLGS